MKLKQRLGVGGRGENRRAKHLFALIRVFGDIRRSMTMDQSPSDKGRDEKTILFDK